MKFKKGDEVCYANICVSGFGLPYRYDFRKGFFEGYCVDDYSHERGAVIRSRNGNRSFVNPDYLGDDGVLKAIGDIRSLYEKCINNSEKI